jgi:phage replication O-like protein O
MSNLAYDDNVSPIRPDIQVVERKVVQLEDGFLRLANELLDATMCSGLPETELCIVMAVWRKTYGFSKKMDWISNEQLEVMIDKHHTHCSTAKNNLIRKKVLIQEGRKIGMNKDISSWETKNNGFCKTLAKPAKKTLAEVAKPPKQKLLSTKDNNTKDKKDNENTMSEQVRTECKKSPSLHEETDRAFEEIFWLAGMVKGGKAKAKSAFRTQFKAWRKESGGTPEQFAQFLADDIASRKGKQFGFDKLHPSTYLNGQRWNDEKPAPEPTQPTNSKFSIGSNGLVFY